MARSDKAALSRDLRLGFLLLLGPLLLACGLVGCAGRRPPVSEPAGAEMGVYRARLESAGGDSRRFRLLLYAKLPDRIHGEILSPVGTTEVIFDGGAGRVSVALPRDRVAFVGDGDADGISRVLGVRVPLGELVGGLLGDRDVRTSVEVSRAPAGRGGLPDTLTLTGAEHRLSLKLKKKQPLRVTTATLGNGEPPPGFEVYPLDELEALVLPDDTDGQAP